MPPCIFDTALQIMEMISCRKANLVFKKVLSRVLSDCVNCLEWNPSERGIEQRQSQNMAEFWWKHIRPFLSIRMRRIFRGNCLQVLSKNDNRLLHCLVMQNNKKFKSCSENTWYHPLNKYNLFILLKKLKVPIESRRWNLCAL